eukprot:gb/GECG01015200.1/.p1 GENE.gb/GECG01015200.1/~~gb/GECG01015200.1/.p1  ORF type:complete len:229 (+),score=41.30 gb/GECG01015200.1/:1-687(+)
MWYARGEWDMAIECFRKSLFWNPEQTATLLNLSSVLLELGFEKDAHQVMLYYDGIDGGTMGGWSHEREEMLRANIEEGIQNSRRRNREYSGYTDGELLLQGIQPEDTYEQLPTKKQASVSEAAEVWSSSNVLVQKKSGKALEEYVELQKRMALENNLAESHGICHGPRCSKARGKPDGESTPPSNSPTVSFETAVSEVDTVSIVALVLCILVVVVLAFLPNPKKRKPH